MVNNDKAGPAVECRWDTFDSRGSAGLAAQQRRPLFLQPELNPLLMSQKTTRAIFLRVHAAVGGEQGGGETHRHLLGSHGNGHVDILSKEIVEQMLLMPSNHIPCF